MFGKEQYTVKYSQVVEEYGPGHSFANDHRILRSESWEQGS